MKLVALLIPFTVACAADPETKPTASKRDAGRALGMASSMLDNIQVRAALPDVNATVNFTEPCPTSGSFTVDGSYEASDDGQHAKLDVDVGFAACAIESEQLDGDVRWTETHDGDDYTATLTGTLAWTGVDATASCTFDVEITFTPAGATYSGTACGYDVSELDGGQ